MRNTFFIFVLVALMLVPAVLGKALADCGEDCDSAYQSATKGCQEIYGDNPEDAGDLAICVLTARLAASHPEYSISAMTCWSILARFSLRTSKSPGRSR